MSAKSIIEVNLDDSQFQDFLAKYNDYQKSLEQMPEQWRSIAQGIGITAKEVGGAQKGAESVSAAFNAGIAALTALNASVGELNGSLTQSTKRQGDFGKKSRDSATFLRKANQHAKSLAGHIKSATGSLLSWGKILGIFSGVLGAGGLFGINKLASVASLQRFNAQGLNTTSGGLDASNINFNRILGNATATLGAIRNAQLDLGQRWKFQALGIKNPDADPSKILPELLRNARDIFNQTGRTQQGAEAYGLTSFMSMEDLTRLSKYSDAQIDAMAKQATADAQRLQLTDNQLRQWQDFNVQLDRSRLNIRSTFVRGLLPLAPQLTRLSSAFSDAVSAVMKSPAIGAGIDWLGNAIKRFSSYLSSPEFPRDVRDFMRGVASLARGTSLLLHLFGLKKETDSKAEIRLAPSLLGPDRKAFLNSHGLVLNYSKTAPVSERNNNPLNLRRAPGAVKRDGFAVFKNMNQGFHAAAMQLARYGSGATFGARVDTINGIIKRWAPESDGNDTRSYINSVVKNTGYKADEHLDLSNLDVLSKLISAMSKVENNKSNYTPSQVKLMIENNTGGSALVSSTQLRGAH
ncbi:hypothetical protein BL250_02300 [Erwinia sp. OLTSP20]|nr:hypothetical protein BV501_16245 [Erwinia sp. OAMSP11]PIJ69447.1 hypothetical protein BK416_15185 [Erwinia sp. OLSSP12]PIJ79281.1 hypothetical protein BLD47_15490 [Erwinia sp. OLCASP19]PIJ80807.1 hypothetical protein BLD46_14650 [Erwinia sp. OLMTSP26]PIJ82959.1 hypothetical protein BLD49_14545 [Erwinia sp. OLMDSP33]PIJ91811.1 hypothetical protein BL249_08355 [Erwinia sp. OLFS4]PIJ94613.1 hypothetical protein BL250_02300 [Erwinia sp. OLTSP20]